MKIGRVCTPWAEQGLKVIFSRPLKPNKTLIQTFEKHILFNSKHVDM